MKSAVLETTPVLMPLIIGLVIACVAVYVWFALALAAVFAKAGEKPARAWIPILNLVVLLRLSGRAESPWLLLVPLYNLVLLAQAFVGVSLRFGRTPGFGIFGFFFAPMWASILGWGSATWLESLPTAHRRQPETETHTDAVDPSWIAAAQPETRDSAYSANLSLFSYRPDSTTEHSSPEPPEEYDMNREASWPEPSSADSTSGQAWDPFAELRDTTGPVEQRARAVPPVPAAPAEPAPTAGPAVPPPPTMSPAEALAARTPSQPMGQPGSTRIKEDSEVIAQSRAGRAMVPPPPAPMEDDGPVRPIVVPGASGTIPGAVPPPAVPSLGGAAPTPRFDPPSFDELLSDSAPSTDGWIPGAANAGTPVSAAPVSVLPTPAPAEPVESDSESWVPRRRGTHQEPLEPGLDESAQVSAVVGSPAAGMPRSALSSVSAQHPEAGVPREDGPDQTEVVSRKRATWAVKLPIGSKVALTSDYVILGRKPQEEPEFPDAQLLPIADGTRTISKTHAVLALVDGAWMITDLGSTNGVVLLDDEGNEQELPAHQPATLTRRFLLGDAELVIEPLGE